MAIPAVLIAAFLLMRISKGHFGDAAVAAVSAGSFAVGLIILSLSPGVNFDVNSYMFGSVLSLGADEAAVAVPVCAAVLLLLLLSQNELFRLTFDADFARSGGRASAAVSAGLAAATAVVTVIGMRLGGVLLVSARIVFPALTAMKCCGSFRSTLAAAAGSALFSLLAGLIISYAVGEGSNVPAGACVVTVQLALYLLARIITAVTGAAKARGSRAAQTKQ